MPNVTHFKCLQEDSLNKRNRNLKPQVMTQIATYWVSIFCTIQNSSYIMRGSNKLIYAYVFVRIKLNIIEFRFWEKKKRPIF